MHIPNDDDNLFISFAEIYDRRLATGGQIATEIETNGIQGWDRFGRFKSFPPDSTEANQVLDSLASGLENNARVDQGEYLERWPIYAYGEGLGVTTADRFGWTQKDMPKFKPIEDPLINKTSATKLASSEAKLLAAFIAKMKFDIDGVNRVSEAARYLDLIDVQMDQKTIRSTLDRARNYLKK